MARLLLKTTSLTCAVLLAACGGGSDDNMAVVNTSTQATITADNQQSIAAEVSANALQFSSSALASTNVAVASQITGSSANATPDIRVLLTTLSAEFAATATPVAPQATAASVSTPLTACVGGGTATATYEDANNNTQWDNNESGNISFSACVVASGFTVNGQMARTYSKAIAVGEGGNTTQNTKLTFTNLKMSINSISTELVSGKVDINSITTITSQTDNYKTTALKVQVKQNAKTANFTLEEEVGFVRSPLNAAMKTVTGTGKITSDNTNINGFIGFAISDFEPIVMSSTEPVTVTSGQMVISGSGGTALYITFGMPNPQTATLQVKKDGQNVGTPKEVSVSALLAGLNSPT
jgi:hypothetical protein